LTPGSRLLALLVVVVAAALTGCSLIGLGIGASIDRDNAGKRKPIEAWQVVAVGPGTPVDVSLRDGGQLSGKYVGLVPVPPEQYADSFERSREANGSAHPPVLGSTVTVAVKSGKQKQGELLGFDLKSLVIREAGGKQPTAVELSRVVRLSDSAGGDVEGETLRRMALAGKIPYLSAMAVDTASGRTQVPLDLVARIDVPKKSHATLTGFLVGAVIDAVLVVAAVNSLNHWHVVEPCNGRTPCTSCPYVYSFDGQRFVLDAEGFGGAIFEAARKPDWVNLPHLKAVDGVYRVRLTNEQREIQYLDEVELLVLDRRPGVRVVPSVSGALHTFAAPVAPQRAADLRGENVLPLLRADRRWVSRPLGEDMDEPRGLRDGLVLEFPRPPGAASVKLAFDIQSTPWASSLLRHVLSLQGRALPAWYERMNSDPTARGSFQRGLAREGLMTVRIWNGEAWQDAGLLANGGAAVPREQAMLADIRSIPGDVLRVRLDSTPGMWTVGGAVADYAPEAPLRVTTLRPASARTETRGDVRALLRNADRRYYTMHPGSSAADLVFAAPAVREGEERSAVLRVAGYYTILVPAEGQPQQALFDRLVSEPGAFGRYSRELLRAEARRSAGDLGSSTTAATERKPAPGTRVKSWDDRRTGRRGDLSAAAPPFPRPAGIRTTRRR